MCELHSSSQRSTFTGYKFVLRHKKTGKFYSSWTGMLYKIGQVPILRKIHQLPNNSINPSYINVLTKLFVPRKKASRKEIIDANQYNWHREHGFRANMIGRTAVFEELESCIHLATSHVQNMKALAPNLIGHYDVAIIKVTLEQDLLRGTYKNCSVIAGRHIKDIKHLDIRL